MRIDGRPFINFSDFHVPFQEGDLLSVEAKRRLPAVIKHSYPGGEGMSEVLNDATVEALVREGTTAGAEEDASVHLDTIAIADEGSTIRGEDLYNIIQEAKAKGVTVSSLMHKLPNASTRVSPRKPDSPGTNINAGRAVCEITIHSSQPILGIGRRGAGGGFATVAEWVGVG